MFPRDFCGILCSIVIAGILSGESALVAVVTIGAAYFCIAVAGAVAIGILGVLHHAEYRLPVGCPQGLFAIEPPGATGMARGSVVIMIFRHVARCIRGVVFTVANFPSPELRTEMLGC